MDDNDQNGLMPPPMQPPPPGRGVGDYIHRAPPPPPPQPPPDLPFTQADNQQLAKLNSGLSSAEKQVWDGTLTPQEGDAFRQQIMHMLTPLQQKQQKHQQQQLEQQNKMALQAAAMQEGVAQQNRVMRAQKFQEGVATVIEPLSGRRAQFAETRPGHWEEIKYEVHQADRDHLQARREASDALLSAGGQVQAYPPGAALAVGAEPREAPPPPRMLVDERGHVTNNPAYREYVRDALRQQGGQPDDAAVDAVVRGDAPLRPPAQAEPQAEPQAQPPAQAQEQPPGDVFDEIRRRGEDVLAQPADRPPPQAPPGGDWGEDRGPPEPPPPSTRITAAAARQLWQDAQQVVGPPPSWNRPIMARDADRIMADYNHRLHSTYEHLLASHQRDLDHQFSAWHYDRQARDLARRQIQQQGRQEEHEQWLAGEHRRGEEARAQREATANRVVGTHQAARRDVDRQYDQLAREMEERIRGVTHNAQGRPRPGAAVPPLWTSLLDHYRDEDNRRDVARGRAEGILAAAARRPPAQAAPGAPPAQEQGGDWGQEPAQQAPPGQGQPPPQGPGGNQPGNQLPPAQGPPPAEREPMGPPDPRRDPRHDPDVRFTALNRAAERVTQAMQTMRISRARQNELLRETEEARGIVREHLADLAHMPAAARQRLEEIEGHLAEALR